MLHSGFLVAVGRGAWLWAATRRLRMQLACTAWLPLQNSLSVGPLRAGPCPGPSASILPKRGLGANRSRRRGRRRPRTSLAMMSRRSPRRARRGRRLTWGCRTGARRASTRWRPRGRHEPRGIRAGLQDSGGGEAATAAPPVRPAGLPARQVRHLSLLGVWGEAGDAPHAALRPSQNT
jgi:hypothetical protein